MINILAIPGSLRASSSSNQILRGAVSSLPADVKVEIYEGVGSLPHFDDPAEDPRVVTEYKNMIRQADAVLICTPEYAFGIPGSLKNALDWTVSSGEFIDKPVGLITASSQGEKGHAALLLVLSAISCLVIEEATLLIPFVRTKVDTSGIIRDHQLKLDLQKIVATLADAARKS